MAEELNLFTPEEGNILIRLLLAHLASDFLLQTRKMVENKRWFSSSMLLHIAVVFLLTALLSGQLLPALAIAATHWLIDGLKMTLKAKNRYSETGLFLFDQLLHVVTIILIWSIATNTVNLLSELIRFPFMDYTCSLIMLGYLIVIGPAGYAIKYATNTLDRGRTQNTGNGHGGKLIGIFERIIILTFVLLGQYEAIGFLITGKSIIRFASHDEHISSEYVLIGTMMSYAISIITGTALNILLAS